MKTFNYERYKNLALDAESVSMIAKIYEKKGLHQNYVESKSSVLDALVESSKIHSAEASNRIEGIVTTTERITALLKRKSKPLNRNEEEIAGYRDVLNTVHSNYRYIPFTSSYILQLHRDLLKYTNLGFAGRYKGTENIITEKDGDEEVIRFEPLKPYETPDAIKDMCEQYIKAIDNEYIDPLVLIPIAIHDFLCSHPFNDGNGRMSRLLTLLLYYKGGFVVGKFISIEKIIEQTKAEYYQTLNEADEGWHENVSNPLPFVKYMLKVLLLAYREFEEKINISLKDKASKQEQVKRVIDNHIGKITKKEIMEQLPATSEPTIKLALNALVKEGYVKVVGTGKNSGYVRTNEGGNK